MDYSTDSLLWNDFESSKSSLLCLDSPVLLTPLPLYQSTPLLTQSTISRLEYHGAAFHDSESESPAKRRKGNLSASSWESIATLSHIPSGNTSIIFNDVEMDGTQSSSQLQLQDLVFNTYLTEIEGLNTEYSQRTETPQRSKVDLLSSTCCEHRCLASFSRLEIESCQKTFRNRNKVEQKQFLLDTVNFSVAEGSKSIKYKLSLSGKQVCKHAYLKVLEISEKRLRNVTTLLKEGTTLSQPQVKRQRPKSDKYTTAAAWMERYFSRIGDKMPHIQQIHLPHFMSRKMVYELMVQDLIDQGVYKPNIISSSHFYALWKDKFRYCVIPKSSLFSKCDICVRFASERLKVVGDKSRREQLTNEYNQHLDLVESERRKYYHHREKSRSEPKKYITVIIDGMDQNKTNVPHITQQTKSSQNLWRLRTHLTGALVHTKSEKGKLAFAFFDLLQWPHDSNLTITVLTSILTQLRSKLDELPPILYLQLDNTARENKNKYVFSFLALLVQLKIFRKIRVNFLPVGHIHEDVDQFFSKISTHLSRVGAETINGLMKVTAQSYTPLPVTIKLKSVYDVRSWLVPHIEDLHGHSQPHCFRFTLDEDERAVMHYKNWSKDGWSEKGLVLLKDVPESCPSAVTPSDEKQDAHQLRIDIPKWKQWLSPQSWEEWEEFLLSGLDELGGTSQDTSPWPLELLASTTQAESLPADDGSETLLLTKERQACLVYTGPRQARSSTVADITTLKVDDMVAVHCENYAREPVIGLCTRVLDTTIDVIWMEGTYTSSWKPWKVRDAKNKRKVINWTDQIPKMSVILFGFTLTTTKYLRKTTIERLKVQYAKLKFIAVSSHS